MRRRRWTPTRDHRDRAGPGHRYRESGPDRGRPRPPGKKALSGIAFHGLLIIVLPPAAGKFPWPASGNFQDGHFRPTGRSMLTYSGEDPVGDQGDDRGPDV